MRSKHLCIVASLLIMGKMSCAQDVPASLAPANITGIPAFAALDGSKENINLANGNVQVVIPLLNLKGRAGLDLNLNLLFDSKSYYWQSDGNDGGGWAQLTYPYPVGLGRLAVPSLSAEAFTYVYESDQYYYTMNYIFTDWNGTPHAFGIETNWSVYHAYDGTHSDLPDHDSYTGLSLDEEDLSINATNPNDVIVFEPNGRQYHFNLNQFGSSYSTAAAPEVVVSFIRDANGNQITFNADATGGLVITDTLQRQVKIEYPSANAYTDSSPSSAPTAQMTVAYHDSNGVLNTIQIDQNTNPVTPNFVEAACGGPTPGQFSNIPSTITVQIPTSAGQMDRYAISDDGLGVIGVSRPAGGYSLYAYQNYKGAMGACTVDVRELTGKIEYSNSVLVDPTLWITGHATTYTPTVSMDTGANLISTVDNGVSREVHSFAQNTTEPIGPGEISVVTYPEGGSTAMKSVTNIYPTVSGVLLQYAPIETDTSIDGFSAAKVQTDYYHITDPLSVEEKREYDYDGSTVLRKTDYTYETGAYANAGIIDLLHSVTITGSNGNASTTIYEHDNYSRQGGYEHISPVQLAWCNPYGNVTAKTTNGVPQYYYYDCAGNIIEAIDGNGYATTYSYADSWASTQCVTGSTYAYPKQISNVLWTVGTAYYNSCTGTVAQVADQNGQTSEFGYDSRNRMVWVTDPDDYSGGPTIITSYAENAAQIQQSYPSLGLVSTHTGDGLNRLVKSQTPNGASTWTTYDVYGRVQSVTNPYFDGPSVSPTTMPATQYTYDALGRKLSEQAPSTQTASETKHWTYSGNVSDVIDESGNDTQYTTDAIGRLIKVVEPDPVSGSHSLETDYKYDSLGNLVQVDQWGGPHGSSGDRIRTFTYDSFSRLVCASNPETSTAQCPTTYTSTYTPGTTGYTYDNNNNVTTKMYPKPGSTVGASSATTIYYTYDVLNRLISKTYYNAPAGTMSSCYQYDSGTLGIGHLGAEWTQSGSCPATLPASGFQTARKFLAYDEMGRITNEQQCTPTNCSGSTPMYSMGTMFYDLSGKLVSYPNGVGSLEFNLVYGTDGQLQTIADSSSRTLFTGSSYTPWGAIQSATLGTRMLVNKSYDNRMRPIGETVTHP